MSCSLMTDGDDDALSSDDELPSDDKLNGNIFGKRHSLTTNDHSAIRLFLSLIYEKENFTSGDQISVQTSFLQESSGTRRCYFVPY